MLVRAVIGCRWQRSIRLSRPRALGLSDRSLYVGIIFLQSRYRSTQRDASSSTTSLVTSRERVGALHEALKQVLDASKYHVEILGSYRREMTRIDEVPILVTGLTDERVPTSSRESYKPESEEIATSLVAEGILALAGSVLEDGTQSYAASQCPGLDVTVQYVPKSCQGSARLFLTGDSSYIRFLRLMSMEAMGLNLNLLGLWKVPNASSKRSKSASSPLQEQIILQGIAIEKIGQNQESEGERRMRATRQAMGLPEGLDLSLDLEANPSANDKVDFNTPLLDRQEAEIKLIQKADQVTCWERVSMKSGSEAEILDLLGLVWIPPQLRSVKGP